MRLRIARKLPPLRLSSEVAGVRLFTGKSFGRQVLKMFDAEILAMNQTASTKRKLSKRGKKPSTYRRIVTGNVNGKAVVQSDEPMPAYEFNTVPGYEHTLIWVNAAASDLREEQRFDRYPDSIVPWPGSTSLHFVTFPPASVFSDLSFDGEAARDEG